MDFISEIQKRHSYFDPVWMDRYLVLRSKPFVGEGYTEEHHILIRSEFPEFLSYPENIVRLKAQDHFLAHYYLFKALPESGKSAWAWFAMVRFNKKLRSLPEDLLQGMSEDYALAMSQRQGTFKGRHHSEESKRRISETLKVNHTRPWQGRKHTQEVIASLSEMRKGEGNPLHGCSWYHNPSSGENRNVHADEGNRLVSMGWVKGRLVPKGVKRWMHSPEGKNSKVSLEDVETLLSEGWTYGRRRMS